jgi:membrane associated rhomboid family serine protease
MSWNPQQSYRRPSPFGGGGFLSSLPPGIKGLLVANVGIYLLQLFFGKFHVGVEGSLNGLILTYFPLWPLDSGYFHFWQFFTYMFLHDGFWHILFNMLMLTFMGIQVESLWETRKFLIYYFLCGLGGGAAHFFLSGVSQGGGPMLGASGAIFGVLIAFGTLFPDSYVRGIMFPFFAIKAKYLVPILIAIELLSINGADNVAHLAHLGGAVTGLIYLLVLTHGHLFSFRSRGSASRPWQPPTNGDAHGPTIFGGARAPFRSRSGPIDAEYQDLGESHQPSQSTTDVKQGRVITQDVVDRILDKIAASGYQNLTEEERDILFEASRRMEERR